MRKLIVSLLLSVCMIVLFSCSASRKAVAKSKDNIFDEATRYLLDAPELRSAHIGIAVYDPAEKRYLYQYNSDKYFTPASNTKIITCYAAMKHLGDSLVGLRYKAVNDTLFVIPSGDPTLLHPDFTVQPAYSFLKNTSYKNISITRSNWNERALGMGWSWDDYNDDYSAERSALPVYGDLILFEGDKNEWSFYPSIKGKIIDSHSDDSTLNFVQRDINANNFRVGFNSISKQRFEVPFATDSGKTNIDLLQQVIPARITLSDHIADANTYTALHSQPTDSLLKIMMHRSDNFFAEQSLLMVSNEMLGTMNDEKIIDTLLKTDYKEMPQQPQWADGSGLSRFNLFTPQDFVFVLDKMRNEFDWKRITNIFPTGGTGTLSGLYKDQQGKIFAKTGTLSNNVALSGYVITNTNKTLIFSVLIGNHVCTAKQARSRIEQCITEIISKY